MDKPILKKNLPVYELLFSDEEKEGLEFISLVKKPATDSTWVTFSESGTLQKFAFQIQDSEKRNIAGAFMIPDLPIYRKDPDTGEEHYVVMSKQTIELMQQKFAASNKWHNINQEHATIVNDTYVLENWIIEDPLVDKSVKFGFSLPAGTWFGVVHIADENYWRNFIKTGEVEGFSIEGLMSRSGVIGTKDRVLNGKFSSQDKISLSELAEFIEIFNKK